MDKLISGLMLAALSGLTFLAYNHPTSYAILYKYLTGILVLLYIGLVIWDGGVRTTHMRLLPLIESEKFDNADDVISGITPKWWVHAAFWFAFIYTAFLVYLPTLLAEK